HTRADCIDASDNLVPGHDGEHAMDVPVGNMNVRAANSARGNRQTDFTRAGHGPLYLAQRLAWRVELHLRASFSCRAPHEGIIRRDARRAPLILTEPERRIQPAGARIWSKPPCYASCGKGRW